MFRNKIYFVQKQNHYVFLLIFCNCYLATHFFVTALHIRPEGHREPRNEVGSLSPAEHLVGVRTGNLPILITMT